MKLKYFDDRWTIIPPAVQAGIDEESVLADFEVLKRMLGKGSYGVVRKVRHKASNRVFALKEMSKAEYKKEVPRYRDAVTLELELCYRVRHPNVARLYSHFEDDAGIYMVMEMAQGRCLYEMIMERPLLEREAACVVAQLLGVLAHIHSQRILHRDIKPENIMVDSELGIKLIDFGISNYFQRGETRDTFCGTEEYLAPEVIKREQQNEKLDIWTVGVLAYEMMVGSSPFYSETEKIRENITNLRLKPFPCHVSAEARSFIHSILKSNPAQRPSRPDLLADPFLTAHGPFGSLPRESPPLAHALPAEIEAGSKLTVFNRAELEQLLGEEDIIKKGAASSVRIREIERQN